MIVGLEIHKALAKSSVLLRDEFRFNACQVWWEPGHCNQLGVERKDGSKCVSRWPEVPVGLLALPVWQGERWV